MYSLFGKGVFIIYDIGGDCKIGSVLSKNLSNPPRKKISFLVTPLTNPEISNTPPPNDLFISQKLSHLFEGPFFNENISLNVLY